MRRLLILAFSSLFLSAVPLAPSLAGNVLLPKEDRKGSSAPNLGLSPAPVLPTLPNSMSRYEIKPPVVKKKTIDRVKPITGVTFQTDLSGLYALRDKDLPNVTTISFGKGSYLGTKEVETIGNTLGLTRSEIDSNCILSVDGKVKMNNGDRSIYGGASQQVQVRYDGVATAFDLNARALCKAKNFTGSKTGTIAKLDDRYVVPLQSFSCPVSKKDKISQLVVLYEGGKAKCFYP